VKPGDLVRWASVHNDIRKDFDVDYGTVLDITFDCTLGGYCANILWDDGTISWMVPDALEVVGRVLTDNELENVMGGMSRERYEVWRCDIINDENEGR